MSNFSKGKYAQFISDRSGQAFPYKEMVREWNGSRVHISEFEPKQPQLEPRAHGADPEGLQNAKPARTEFPTQEFLPHNPFVTASNTTLKILFPDLRTSETYKNKHRADPTGESFTTSKVFYYPNNSYIIAVKCFDWSPQSNRTDHLRIIIKSKQFNDWISEK